MDNELSYLTITEALALSSGGRIAPGELTRACHQQIERFNPIINAFITVTEVIGKSPGSAARGSPDHAEVPAEPGTATTPPLGMGMSLAGIPIALKDLIETAGVRTTAGSLFFEDYLPERDAQVVAALKAAGATLPGKTNTHEIALGVTNINPHFGACRNPWDTTRISGGSSGGSAAAVAAGMCLGALGTDTGGSIRIPASLCGVVGLKPTHGRVSLRGVLPLSWNLDHVGPLTRTMKDAAILLGVLAGYDPEDPASQDQPLEDYLEHIDEGVRGWKLALVVGEFTGICQPEVWAAVRSAAQVMRDLGANVEEVEIDWLYQAAETNGLITQADAAAVHRERLDRDPARFGPDVRERLENGLATTSSDYIRARRLQAETRRRCETTFQEYDALLLPSTPIPALPIDAIGNSASQAPALTRFTAPFNLTGMPALSLPCGFTGDGLPIGLQIVCGPWQEASLLRAGQAYEGATGWGTRRPEMSR